MRYPAPPAEPIGEGLQVQRAYRSYRQRVQRHGRARQQEVGLVVMAPSGARIAAIAGHHVYVDKAYRKRGLGAELVALFHVVFPEMLHYCAEEIRERFYSYSGEHTYRRAYQLLLARGAVEKPA